MKKRLLSAFFLFILFILLVSPLALSLEVTLSKSTYSPRETLQAEITGNFISLTPDNINIYKPEKVHSEPVIKDLTKQNNKYYFYAILPNEEANLFLKIENAEYIESGLKKSDTIIKNFTIKRTNSSALSINPGFIVTSNDFSIKIKALNSNQNINAVFEATGETKALSLNEEDEETVGFSVSNINTTKSNLKIGTYTIPVFILQKATNNISVERKINCSLRPSEIRGTLVYGRDYFFKLELENTGNVNLTDIQISNDFNSQINPNPVKLLKPGEIIIVNLTIPSSKTINNFSGEIITTFENKTIVIMPVYFEITKNETKANITTGSEPSQSLSCRYIGSICTQDQKCTGEITPSLEGLCCKGTCSNKAKSSGSNWIYGIVLLIILVGILGYVYWKAKKKQKPKSTKEILEEKSDEFEDRMAGEEVKGKIGRI